MRFLICFLFTTLCLSNSFAEVDTAQAMVPRGKIVESSGRDFIVKTKAGTKIGIQFTLDGKFEEASGKNLNQGDELEPGYGLISLSSAAQILQKSGIKPEGYWLLEKDQKMGWIYEVKKNIINATSGEVIKKSPEISTSENVLEDTSLPYRHSL